MGNITGKDRSHVLRVSDADLAKDLSGKVYIVTGSNSGVGLETTRQLVKQQGHVIMACRRPNAADEAAESFTTEKLSGTYESMKCDLGDLSSVLEFCTNFLKKYKRLDGLVCNAGIVNLHGAKTITKDGLETTIGVSYFGHFLMTELLLDVLKQTKDSRYVILSSCVSAGNPKNRYQVNTEDLNFETRKFANFQVYGEAKVACCLYALELAQRLKSNDVITASVHPGWARSNFNAGAPWYLSITFKLLDPFIYHMTDSSEESSQSTLYVLLNDTIVPKHSGEYFSQHSYLYEKGYREGGWPMTNPNPNTRDINKAKELVNVTRKIVGLE